MAFVSFLFLVIVLPVIVYAALQWHSTNSHAAVIGPTGGPCSADDIYSDAVAIYPPNGAAIKPDNTVTLKWTQACDISYDSRGNGGYFDFYLLRLYDNQPYPNGTLIVEKNITLISSTSYSVPVQPGHSYFWNIVTAREDTQGGTVWYNDFTKIPFSVSAQSTPTPNPTNTSTPTPLGQYNKLVPGNVADVENTNFTSIGDTAHNEKPVSKGQHVYCFIPTRGTKYANTTCVFVSLQGSLVSVPTYPFNTNKETIWNICKFSGWGWYEDKPRVGYIPTAAYFYCTIPSDIASGEYYMVGVDTYQYADKTPSDPPYKAISVK